MALFIGPVLGKDTTQVSHAGFGAAISLFARPSHQLRFAHRHTSPVGAHIHNRYCTATRMGFSLLPLLGRRPHPLHHALDLPSTDMDAAGFFQVLLCFLIAGFIGPLQTDQASQGRSMSALQTQSGIRRIISLLLAFMVIIGPLQDEGAKHPVNPRADPALVLLPRFGLIGGINARGCFLEQPAHQRAGGFENGRTNQHLQLLNGNPGGLLSLEPCA